MAKVGPFTVDLNCFTTVHTDHSWILLKFLCKQMTEEDEDIHPEGWGLSVVERGKRVDEGKGGLLLIGEC